MPMNDKAVVDTNILIYATNRNSVFHKKAKLFLEQRLPSGSLSITVQNITEFYAIVTNAKRIEEPLNQNRALEVIRTFIESGYFQIITPKNKTAFLLLRLLKNHSIKSAEIHDIHLAAVMIDNNISTIYTADTSIFKKLGLNAINPLK